MKFNKFMKLNGSKMMLLVFLNLDLKFSIFFNYESRLQTKVVLQL